MLVGTVVRVCLNTHLVELGKFVETGRHRTSVVTAQYLQNLLCRGACTLTLHGIHGELILRIVWLKCGINRANLITLFQSVDQVHCNIVQLLDCTTLTILQVECKSSRSTEARNHRWGRGCYGTLVKFARILLDALLYGTYAMLLALTLIPMFESEVEATIRRTCRITATCQLTISTHLLHIFEDVVVDTVENLLGLQQRCSRRGGNLHIDCTHILTRYQTCLGGGHKVVKQTASGNQ